MFDVYTRMFSKTVFKPYCCLRKNSLFLTPKYGRKSITKYKRIVYKAVKSGTYKAKIGWL